MLHSGTNYQKSHCSDSENPGTIITTRTHTHVSARDSVQPELRSFHIRRSTALRSDTHSCLLFASCSNGFPAVPSKAQHKHRCSRAQYSRVSHLRATNRNYSCGKFNCTMKESVLCVSEFGELFVTGLRARTGNSTALQRESSAVETTHSSLVGTKLSSLRRRDTFLLKVWT